MEENINIVKSYEYWLGKSSPMAQKRLSYYLEAAEEHCFIAEQMVSSPKIIDALDANQRLTLIEYSLAHQDSTLAGDILSNQRLYDIAVQKDYHTQLLQIFLDTLPNDEQSDADDVIIYQNPLQSP